MKVFSKYHDFKKERTLVLLHGFLGSSDDWNPFISAFGSTHNIFTIDLPGHGASDISGTLTFESAIYAVHSTIQSYTGHESVDCLGYSMGGRFAAALIQLFPKKYVKGTFVSTGFFKLDDAQSQARLSLDASRADAIVNHFSQFLIEWYSQDLFYSPNFASIRPQLLSSRSSQDASKIATAIRSFSPAICQLGPIDLSHSHFIVGEYDINYLTHYLDILPHHSSASISILRNCGHMCFLEHPKAFMDAVLAH